MAITQADKANAFQAGAEAGRAGAARAAPDYAPRGGETQLKLTTTLKAQWLAGWDSVNAPPPELPPYVDPNEPGYPPDEEDDDETGGD